MSTGRELAIAIVLCIIVPVTIDAVLFTAGSLAGNATMMFVGTSFLSIPLVFLPWMGRALKGTGS
jgi:hypothetical protein